MWAGLMQGGAAVNWIPVNASPAVPHSNEVEAQNDRISPSWRQVAAMLLSEKFIFVTPSSHHSLHPVESSMSRLVVEI
jgi:hypothetical protein